MKFFFNMITVLMAVLFVSACNSVKTGAVNDRVPEAALCQQVKQIVNQHKNGFEQIKGQIQLTKNMDIWEAKYQLVGKNCQIWHWSNGKQVYMCSLTVPDKETADIKINNAISFTKKCLGKKWKHENIQRNNSESSRNIFSKQDEKTVASIHGVNTKGLFRSEWTVYYFIGDRDKTL